MYGFLKLLLILGVFEALDATFSIEQIKQASKKCCTQNRQECCMDMIKFGGPIRCGYENHSRFPRLVYNCLQNELFPNEPEKRMDLDDSVCCSIYGEDRNDPNKRCESTCKLAMSSPSLDASTKIGRVQSCSLLDSDDLFKCFENCQMLRRKGHKIEVLHFSEYCNSTYIQKRPVRHV